MSTRLSMDARGFGSVDWQEYLLSTIGERPGGQTAVVAGEVTRRILAAYEAGDLITMCAWCRRVEIDGEWVLAPQAALTAIEADYTLSHSICPECAAQRLPATS